MQAEYLQSGINWLFSAC